MPVYIKAINDNDFDQGGSTIHSVGVSTFLTAPNIHGLLPASMQDGLTDKALFRQEMERATKSHASTTITTSSATTAQIDFAAWAGGFIVIPTGSTITTLTFYTNIGGGTIVPLNDSDGAAVTLTVAADNAYPLPEACFGAETLIITGDAAGTIDVHLKG